MLRLLTALVATVALAASDDLSVQQLTLKALDKALSKSPLIRMNPRGQDTLHCAIPLKEVRAGRSRHIDPLGRRAGSPKIDQIAHPAPIQACPNR